MKKITVVGCGKTGRAFAYSMLKQGNIVRLFDINERMMMGAYMDLYFCGHVKAGLGDKPDLIFLSAASSDLSTILLSVDLASVGDRSVPIYVFSNPVKEIAQALKAKGYLHVLPCDASLDRARHFRPVEIQEDIHASPVNKELYETREHWLKLQEEEYFTPSIYNAIYFAEKQLKRLKMI